MAQTMSTSAWMTSSEAAQPRSSRTSPAMRRDTTPSLSRPHGLSTLGLPAEVVRKAIANAIAHRRTRTRGGPVGSNSETSLEQQN